MKYLETNLQISCVQWFDLQYPKYKPYLIHIPNGGIRPKKFNKFGTAYSPEATRLKKMGTRAGVSDLFFMMPNGFYNGIWIEMKSANGRLTESQQEFQANVEKIGYMAITCNSFEAFKDIIESYLNNTVSQN